MIVIVALAYASFGLLTTNLICSEELAKSSFNQELLYHLGTSNDDDVMRFLERKDFNPNLPLESHMQNSALHQICLRKGKPIELLNYCFNRDGDVNIKNTSDETPLHLAAYGGSYEVVNYLLSVDQIDLNPKDHMGETPLIRALRYSYSLDRQPTIVALLNNSGVHKDVRDKDGNPAWLLPLREVGNQKEFYVSKVLPHYQATFFEYIYSRQTGLSVLALFIELDPVKDNRNLFETITKRLLSSGALNIKRKDGSVLGSASQKNGIQNWLKEEWDTLQEAYKERLETDAMMPTVIAELIASFVTGSEEVPIEEIDVEGYNETCSRGQAPALSPRKEEN